MLSDNIKIPILGKLYRSTFEQRLFVGWLNKVDFTFNLYNAKTKQYYKTDHFILINILSYYDDDNGYVRTVFHMLDPDSEKASLSWTMTVDNEVSKWSKFKLKHQEYFLELFDEV